MANDHRLKSKMSFHCFSFDVESSPVRWKMAATLTILVCWFECARLNQFKFYKQNCLLLDRNSCFVQPPCVSKTLHQTSQHIQTGGARCKMQCRGWQQLTCFSVMALFVYSNYTNGLKLINVVNDLLVIKCYKENPRRHLQIHINLLLLL